ncbi:cation-efflux pump [Anaerofilum sp. An201]|nr:cation diffusion facilitator family transporter [Anaerofilum sp. An201]OUP02695.1 cation-efflux pump [Anaerofilum sp. An201]
MTEFLLRRFVRGYPDVSRPESRTACGNMAGAVGIVCNLLLCGFKFLAGIVTGSVAISADAVNNLSDASSSIITLLGFRMSAKPADAEHPYGHGRTEYLSGLAVSVMILLIGLELVKSSVEKILHPAPIEAGVLPVVILSVSILVKLWMAAFNRKLGRLIASPALEATAADSRNDVISTGAVLAATLLQMAFHWQLDGWMGLAVALFILYSGWGLVKDAIAPLLGQAPDPELVAHILEVTREYPGVLGIHDLIVHDYGPGRRFASLHVEMDAAGDVLRSHDIIDQIERRFLAQDGLHVIIHYDPIVTGDGQTAYARDYLARAVKSIDPRLTIHDLRMVPGHTHTNLIFDLVVPHDFEMPVCRLKAEVAALAKKENPHWECVMTVENSYT